MSRYISLRLSLTAVLAAVVLPAAALGQSQDSESVAEAARRTREQKKSSAKPARVINDDNLKPASAAAPSGAASDAAGMSSVPSGEAQAAEPCVSVEQSGPALPPGISPDSLAEPPHKQRRCVPASANGPSQPPEGESAPAQPSTESGNSTGAPDQKSASELAKLTDELKEAQKEVDLLQRELFLEQDSYLSNPDHVHDTAGKSKLDTMQQGIGDKQQVVDRLKARLAVLKEAQGASKSTPPQP